MMKCPFDFHWIMGGIKLEKSGPTLTGEVKARLQKESRGSFVIVYEALREAKKASGSDSLDANDVVYRIRKKRKAATHLDWSLLILK